MSTTSPSVVAAQHGITEADAALFLTSDDPDTLTAQAERLASVLAVGNLRRGGPGDASLTGRLFDRMVANSPVKENWGEQ